jgi:hypothetical protein
MKKSEQKADAEKPKRARKKIAPSGHWVRLERVAAYFDTSVDFIRRNSVTLGIRTDFIGGELRAWWPDVLALSDKMLKRGGKPQEYIDNIIETGTRKRAL